MSKELAVDPVVLREENSARACGKEIRPVGAQKRGDSEIGEAGVHQCPSRAVID